MSVARRGVSGQARVGKGRGPRLHAIPASLTLLPLPILALPAIVHMPIRTAVVISMAVAALALCGVCQRYRSMDRAVSRATAGGGAASLLTVAGRIACTAAYYFEAFSYRWRPPATNGEQ